LSKRWIVNIAMSEDGIVTVLLGRFDPLVQLGLTQILNSDDRLRVVGADLDGAALEQSFARWAPGVAILDETTEYSLLARLRITYATTGILILAHDPSRAYGMRLLSAGAACIGLDTSSADILASVRSIVGGVDACALADEQLTSAKTYSLTPREIEVLEYLSRGLSHAEIALELRIGVETVRTHAARVRRKLNVRNKRELIGVVIPG
jgi:DNA-binding NarL/FixJ family response regulator